MCVYVSGFCVCVCVLCVTSYINTPHILSQAPSPEPTRSSTPTFLTTHGSVLASPSPPLLTNPTPWPSVITVDTAWTSTPPPPLTLLPCSRPEVSSRDI
ncbi:hypothetical protein EON63_10595 [archaeon]|nr:MAG: hypothetical protein EON63_10595 [archaeon]